MTTHTDLIRRLDDCDPHDTPAHARDLLCEAAGEVERLRAVIETKGIGDAYRDGFDAAVAVANSLTCHVTWGPEATPDDGLKHGIEACRRVMEKSRAALQGQPEGK